MIIHSDLETGYIKCLHVWLACGIKKAFGSDPVGTKKRRNKKQCELTLFVGEQTEHAFISLIKKFY